MAIYKLSDIVETIRGNCSFQKKDLQRQGDYKALHYGKTYGFNYINDEFPFWVDKKFFKLDQLVVLGDIIWITTTNMKKNLGKVVYYNSGFPGLLGGEQILIKTKNNLVVSKWLYYWLKINQNKFLRFATGTTVFRVKSKDLNYININLPSLDEQKQIIDIIEPLENSVQKLGLLSKNLLNFGDQIIKIDESNCLIELKEIASVARGGTPSIKEAKYWNNGTIPWINSRKLTNSIVNKKADKKITKEALSKTKIVKKKEVILSRIEPNINSISISRENQAVNDSVVIIKSNQNLFFNLRNKIKDLSLMKIGTAQQSINNNHLKKWKINVGKTNFFYLTGFLYCVCMLQEKIEAIKSKLILLNIYQKQNK